MSTIKCYDTLKCMYVEVEVTEEVYTYIKRSYWREDMQDRRYQARKLLFDTSNQSTAYSTTSILSVLDQNKMYQASLQKGYNGEVQGIYFRRK